MEAPKCKLRSEVGLLNARQAEADGGGHRGDRQDDAARAVEAGERNILSVSTEAGKKVASDQNLQGISSAGKPGLG